jgi:hypothetical protein
MTSARGAEVIDSTACPGVGFDNCLRGRLIHYFPVRPGRSRGRLATLTLTRMRLRRQRMVRPFFALSLALCAAATTAQGTAAETREPPDSKHPTAGICLPPQPGAIATFTFGIDGPRPRCGEVLPTQRLAIANDTQAIVTIKLYRTRYEILPGAKRTFAPRFGDIWEPGVHRLRASGGAEVILIRAFPDSALQPPAAPDAATLVGLGVLVAAIALTMARAGHWTFGQLRNCRTPLTSLAPVGDSPERAADHWGMPAMILKIGLALLGGFAVFAILAPTSGAGARCYSFLFGIEVPCEGGLAIAAGAVSAAVLGVALWRASRPRMT